MLSVTIFRPIYYFHGCKIICRKYIYPCFEMLHVAYCAYGMTLHKMEYCILYAWSHRVELGVGAWYCYSQFLVNEW